MSTQNGTIEYTTIRVTKDALMRLMLVSQRLGAQTERIFQTHEDRLLAILDDYDAITAAGTVSERTGPLLPR